MNFIKTGKIFVTVSAILVLISIVLVSTLHLKTGIDLKGGTKWSVEIKNEKANENLIAEALQKNREDKDVGVRKAEGSEYVIRLGTITENEHQEYKTLLVKEFGELREVQFSSIGPVIGRELASQAIWAIILVLLGISLYVAFAFRKSSQKIRSWKYGVVTLVTLFHDVAIPAGLLAILGVWKGVELDTNLIVALLVVIGFSVHDTIVVFDRIREHIIKSGIKNIPLEMIMNQSVEETIARSINTSLTLIIVLLALLGFGPANLFYFVLIILVGTVIGTYSSIFVATPLLYLWAGRKTEEKRFENTVH